jgi:hypothetical protein
VQVAESVRVLVHGHALAGHRHNKALASPSAWE